VGAVGRTLCQRLKKHSSKREFFSRWLAQMGYPGFMAVSLLAIQTSARFQR